MLTLLIGVKVTKRSQVIPVSCVAAPIELPNRIGDAAEFSMPLSDGINQIKGNQIL